jgi:hypothetical protein
MVDVAEQPIPHDACVGAIIGRHLLSSRSNRNLLSTVIDAVLMLPPLILFTH